MVEYETICPDCKKKIIIEVDDEWIREICSDIAMEYRESKEEAYD